METRQPEFVIGQRYTLATVALLLAFLSFINFAGAEKAVFAIVLAWRALSVQPAPRLQHRRGWAKTAVFVGAGHIIMVTTVIVWNRDRLWKIFEAIRALSELR